MLILEPRNKRSLGYVLDEIINGNSEACRSTTSSAGRSKKQRRGSSSKCPWILDQIQLIKPQPIRHIMELRAEEGENLLAESTFTSLWSCPVACQSVLCPFYMHLYFLILTSRRSIFLSTHNPLLAFSCSAFSPLTALAVFLLVPRRKNRCCPRGQSRLASLVVILDAHESLVHL